MLIEKQIRNLFTKVLSLAGIGCTPAQWRNKKETEKVRKEKEYIVHPLSGGGDLDVPTNPTPSPLPRVLCSIEYRVSSIKTRVSSFNWISRKHAHF